MALSGIITVIERAARKAGTKLRRDFGEIEHLQVSQKGPADFVSKADQAAERTRSEEHTSELQSLMRISYAVFCLKKKRKKTITYNYRTNLQHHEYIISFT